jgi:hypothetical protein
MAYYYFVERLAHMDRATASGAVGGRFEPGIAHVKAAPRIVGLLRLFKRVNGNGMLSQVPG